MISLASSAASDVYKRQIQWAAENGLNTIMWIPTVKALRKRFEIYKDAKSKAENRDVPLGEGISLVRDMFVACLLYTSPSPRDRSVSRMPSSA